LNPVALYSCTQVSLASLSGFLPIILKSLGYTSLGAQTLSIPVYGCAGVSLLLLGFLSDRFKHRGYFLILAFALSSLGWIILLASPNSSQRNLAFGGTFLVAIGAYPQVILILSWMNSNVIGFTKRAGCLAALNMVGQCFAIAGAQMFHTEAPYVKGMAFALAFSALGAVTAAALMLHLSIKNKKKREEQWGEQAERLRGRGLEEVCERHPDFFFWL
jgi:MFS family permease